MGLVQDGVMLLLPRCANPGVSLELKPMDLDLTDQIKTLVEKATSSDDGGDAMRFSQAATNVAHAMDVVSNIKRKQR
jgi:hypothetical protein